MKRTILLTLLALLPLASHAEEVRIYSERHYEADGLILARFTEKTGIKVKLVKAGADELIARLKSEKSDPQADLYITVDAATLERARQAGLMEPHGSEKLKERIPEGLASKDGTWVPITMRARVIAYSKERVKNPPATYEDLAKPEYRGRILIRSSASHYNQSLLASIIAASGKAKGMEWAKGVQANMARPPQGGDRDQVRGVEQGIGDLAVTNSYYLGLLEQSEDPKDRAAREAVGIVFPNQDGRGTHVNISGGGIVKGAANHENAVALLEFLTSGEIQKDYQKLTSEFAVVEGIAPEPFQKAWGEFKPDFTNIHKLAENYEEAVKTLNIVGWP